MRQPNEVVKKDGHNYKIYTDNKSIVVAVCKHGNNSYRGIAKCMESDTFDYELGKKIAILRSDIAIEKVKLNEYQKKKDEINDMISKCICDFKYLMHISEEIGQRYLNHQEELDKSILGDNK